MFKILKIKGNSLSPALNAGDFVFTVTQFFTPELNKFAVVEHPFYGKIIKRIIRINQQGDLLLEGENTSSISTFDMGWVKPEWITGLVKYSFKCSSTQTIS